MRTLQRGCLALFVSLTSLSYCQAASNDPKDVAAIQKVIDTFNNAFREKDVESFVELFYSKNPDEVVWQFVVEDTRLERVQKFKPEARKTRHVPGNTYLGAIQAIAADPVITEEKFRNVRIDTDGEVGSVNFDYIVLYGGKEQNWGREMWHLVRTDKGWKLISVIYSARDPVPEGKQPSVK